MKNLDYSVSAFLPDYVKEAQLGSLRFSHMPWECLLSVTTVQPFFSSWQWPRSTDDAVLSCAASPSLGIAIREATNEKCFGEVINGAAPAVCWTSSKWFFSVTLFGKQKFFKIILENSCDDFL